MGSRIWESGYSVADDKNYPISSTNYKISDEVYNNYQRGKCASTRKPATY